MIIRVERGKGGDSRDLPLSPALLETLREYWRWKKPRIYLFPGSIGQRGDQDRPISDKTVWYACKEAARHARITKHVTPHTLRHSWAKVSPSKTLVRGLAKELGIDENYLEKLAAEVRKDLRSHRTDD
jgi:integrase